MKAPVLIILDDSSHAAYMRIPEKQRGSTTLLSG